VEKMWRTHNEHDLQAHAAGVTPVETQQKKS